MTASSTPTSIERLPRGEILDRIDELDRSVPTLFFCNGPQCKATPDAIAALLDAGYRAAGILYYRRGIHDWVTLGYPLSSRS
jgi:hypothetical protein